MFRISAQQGDDHNQRFRFSQADFPTIVTYELAGSCATNSRREAATHRSPHRGLYFNKEHCRRLHPLPMPLGRFHPKRELSLRSRLISIYIRPVFTRAGNCAGPRTDRTANQIPAFSHKSRPCLPCRCFLSRETSRTPRR